MLRKSLSEGVGVFLKNGGEEFLVDFTQAEVVACLDPVVVGDGIHDVGFHENDGAVIEAIRQKVASVEVRAVGDSSKIGSSRMINERR